MDDEKKLEVEIEIPSSELSKKGVHETPQKALEAVGSEFNHWSGKLTENSLQMCYALIGANWVVYGSVGNILQSEWAKLSLLMVILTLAINVIGSWYFSESLRRRFEWAESHSTQWEKEFQDAVGARTAFPFIEAHEKIGFWLRQVKGLLPLVSGAFLIVGAVIKS
jgi:hypothetical protein